MRILFNNLGYFLKEVKTSIAMNLMPNLFSILSIGLIFFILAMIFAGWQISGNIAQQIQNEAEINVFFEEDLSRSQIDDLNKMIKGIDGVNNSVLVTEQEAYKRMVEILGAEAEVLEVFESNPFTSFIEVSIVLPKLDSILAELQTIEEIIHLRDNYEILNQFEQISNLLKYFGLLVIIVVGISTLIITSHIIKLGIYSKRNEIQTLRLLGASERFISIPFVLEGIIFGFSGGLIALTMIVTLTNVIYNSINTALPFIPLISPGKIIYSLLILLGFTSILLGFLGSILGIYSSKNT